MEIILYGNPITKKNSSQIGYTRTGRPILVPSKQYKKYARDCKTQITGVYKKQIDYPVNVRVVYYMQRRYKVDLTNLLNATNDILVECGVLTDDNSRIIIGHDGSRVYHDKNNPRVEIYIEPIEAVGGGND